MPLACVSCRPIAFMLAENVLESGSGAAASVLADTGPSADLYSLSTSMQALTYNAETGRVALETRPVPQPSAGEALIRVRRAGICSTVCTLNCSRMLQLLNCCKEQTADGSMTVTRLVLAPRSPARASLDPCCVPPLPCTPWAAGPRDMSRLCLRLQWRPRTRVCGHHRVVRPARPWATPAGGPHPAAHRHASGGRDQLQRRTLLLRGCHLPKEPRSRKVRLDILILPANVSMVHT